MRSIASSARLAVRTARFWTEVNTRSRSMPLSRINAPAARASASPCSVTSTSHQPVKRFSRFHWLWPWRRRTRVGMGLLRLQLGQDLVQRVEAGVGELLAPLGAPTVNRIGQRLVILERHFQR